MSSPLFFTSSKPASTEPEAGQTMATSSSVDVAVVALWTGGTGAGVTVTGATAVAVTVDPCTGVAVAVPVPAGATGTGAPLAGLFAAITIAGGTPIGTAVGGTTRSTCPTSIRLGLTSAFQRAMSRQLWPVSRPMRVMVSPGLTV